MLIFFIVGVFAVKPRFKFFILILIFKSQILAEFTNIDTSKYINSAVKSFRIEIQETI